MFPTQLLQAMLSWHHGYISLRDGQHRLLRSLCLSE